MGVEKLVELAKKIKDKNLREKTVELIRDIKLTNPHFSKYQKEDVEKVKTPFTVNGITVQRDLLNHTLAVAKACISMAELIEKSYGVKINIDYLLAAALLHDIMKVFEWKDGKYTGILLDHSTLGAAELYKRDFPEEVIHIVASHMGTSEPRSIEALILHYVDTMLALVEFYTGNPLVYLG